MGHSEAVFTQHKIDLYSVITIAWSCIMGVLNKFKWPSDTSASRVLLSRINSLKNSSGVILGSLLNPSVVEFRASQFTHISHSLKIGL